MYNHVAVLAKEAIKALNIKPNGIYVDATFGRGGHSKLILKELNSKGRLIVFDKDPEAIMEANLLSINDKRLTAIHTSFSNLKDELMKLNINFIDGILLDLGVSSLQLDDPNRGFGFKNNSILDMRMNNSQGITAKQWLNEASEKDIANVIYKYGDEKLSRKIAREIVSNRRKKEIATTFELADIVNKSVKRKNYKIHPATKTFQAIRILINNELEEIKLVLPQIIDVLNKGGRMVVISFHSLEDKIVKDFINVNSSKENFPKWVAIKDEDLVKSRLLKIGKHLKPQKKEILNNRRSRSAVLRIAQKN